MLKQLAVVCCVRQKVRRRDLEAAQRVPSRVTWPRTRTTHFSMVTDVQRLGSSELQQQAVPVVGPGDELQASAASSVATIGLALRHREFGRVVTTAGHAFVGSTPGTRLFDPATPTVRVANVGASGTFDAVPLKAVRVPEGDYALLRPQAEPRNLFQDSLNLSGLHFARPEDEGTPLFAMTRRGLEPTVLRGVAATFVMGGVQMRGLFLTDPVTVAGDSGCCLVDSSFRVWGLLVGLQVINGRPKSIFAAADWVLALEIAELG